MSDSSVRLAGRLPDGNRNGLASIAHLLVDDPSQVHVAIVLIDCAWVKTSTDDGSALPTARVRAIEPIPEGRDADEMRRLLRRAIETRTGQTTLPLELERDLDDLGIHALEDEPRPADARERAAGDREDPLTPSPDSPLPAPDAIEPSPDEVVVPTDPLAPSPDAALDAPDADDVLADDDPRRGPLPRGGLFMEPPAAPASDDDEL